MGEVLSNRHGVSVLESKHVFQLHQHLLFRSTAVLGNISEGAMCRGDAFWMKVGSAAQTVTANNLEAKKTGNSVCALENLI